MGHGFLYLLGAPITERHRESDDRRTKQVDAAFLDRGTFESGQHIVERQRVQGDGRRERAIGRLIVLFIIAAAVCAFAAEFTSNRVLTGLLKAAAVAAVTTSIAQAWKPRPS